MKAGRRRSSVKTLLMFLVFGPPIGGVVLGLVFSLSDVFDGGHVVWSTLSALPILALLGYIYGFLPALLTGLAAGVMSRRIGGSRVWLLAVTATGAISSAVCTAVFVPSLYFVSVLAAIGAVAAFASGVLSLAVRPLVSAVRPRGS